MHFSRTVNPKRLGEFLSAQYDAPLSYPDVGASLDQRPAGYRHDSHSVALGAGDTTHRRAVQGLVEWQAHRAAHVLVHPSDAPIEVDTTVALALPFLGVHVLAACRIVAVVREPNRFGFAYGTLTSHPEQGEEAFLIERTGDDIHFRISAFSRPRDPLARLGSPLARRVQRRVTRAYLAGLRAYSAHDV